VDSITLPCGNKGQISLRSLKKRKAVQIGEKGKLGYFFQAGERGKEGGGVEPSAKAKDVHHPPGQRKRREITYTRKVGRGGNFSRTTLTIPGREKGGRKKGGRRGGKSLSPSCPPSKKGEKSS